MIDSQLHIGRMQSCRPGTCGTVGHILQCTAACCNLHLVFAVVLFAVHCSFSDLLLFLHVHSIQILIRQRKDGGPRRRTAVHIADVMHDANPGCCICHMMVRSSCTPSTSFTASKGSSMSTAAHLSD